MPVSPSAAMNASTSSDQRAWGVVAGLFGLCIVYALLQPGQRLQDLTGTLGLAVFLLIAIALSSRRSRIRPGIIAWGLGLQLFVATLVLRVPWTAEAFATLSGYVQTMLDYSFEGSKFLFGELGAKGGGSTHLGFLFAFQVLPVIIFIASFFAVLYYIGLMPLIVRAFARVMTRLMGASGAESLNVAASIFMGQTEAPLTIRPFLSDMTESELFTVMVSGMAHVSGAMMAAYVLVAHVEVRHLLTAVIMTAPATIMLAKVMCPETGQPVTAGTVKVEIEKTDVNVIDAAARGAVEGMHLALNVGAVLIAFVAIIALVDGVLKHIHTSLEGLLGAAFSPVAWLMGIPWHEAHLVGGMLGTRMIVNEFVAYAQLGPLQGVLDHHAFVITTFALCGFANLASIGIQIGGIGSLAPNRKHDLARLGVRAMLAGTLANFMSAAIAGMLIH